MTLHASWYGMYHNLLFVLLIYTGQGDVLRRASSLSKSCPSYSSISSMLRSIEKDFPTSHSLYFGITGAKASTHWLAYGIDVRGGDRAIDSVAGLPSQAERQLILSECAACPCQLRFPSWSCHSFYLHWSPKDPSAS